MKAMRHIRSSKRTASFDIVHKRVPEQLVGMRSCRFVASETQRQEPPTVRRCVCGDKRET